jgi:uncharacterized protein (TIGR00725 family)
VRKPVIGVMGPGAGATASDLKNATQLGKQIAEKGWILLSGGRAEGVMNAVNQGAKAANGLTVGIIPTNDNDGTSEFVDVAIITDMGSARNNINVLSSDVVIACGMGSGTASEIALALKAKKQVILLTDDLEAKIFFKKLGGNNVLLAESVEESISAAEKLLKSVR